MRFFSVAELRVFAVPAPAKNVAPVAHAGVDFETPSRVRVALDGTASWDPDGSSVTHEWKQAAGPGVSLSNRRASSPTFVAPTVQARARK